MTDQQTPSPQPHTEDAEQPKPLLTKSVASVACGIASIPTCLCFGIPSLLLGATAIWLGLYVRKNFRDSTASEVANLYAWIGIISGSIGVVLGAICFILLLFGSGASLFQEATGSNW